MIKSAEILIESSKGGQWAKWGITDEVLWEHNPSLVIAHISGYGQYGDSSYISRPCFDPVAQAFSGYSQYNGYTDRPPITTEPYAGDYFTALFAVSSTLAAYQKALKTGKGESIDVAQYECLVRVQSGFPSRYFAERIPVPRSANRNQLISGWGSYLCKDGQYIYILAGGAGALKNALQELGFEYGSELFPAGATTVFIGTPAAEVFEEKWEEYFSTMTASEAEKRLTEVGVPCSLVMDLEKMENHPHYVARETFMEWETLDGNKIKGASVIPKFRNNPGKIWRGAPTKGMDNDEILRGLGLSDDEIYGLYKQEIVSKK